MNPIIEPMSMPLPHIATVLVIPLSVSTSNPFPVAYHIIKKPGIKPKKFAQFNWKFSFVNVRMGVKKYKTGSPDPKTPRLAIIKINLNHPAIKTKIEKIIPVYKPIIDDKIMRFF